jgi:hypothetical protein
VNTGDDPRLFQAKLDGGYDWVHAVQYAAKVVRGKIFERGSNDARAWGSS